jgi:hypothetical protein
LGAGPAPPLAVDCLWLRLVAQHPWPPCQRGERFKTLTPPPLAAAPRRTPRATEQDGFSYASVEVSGFDADAFDPADMLARVAAIFRPDTLSVSLSVDASSRCGNCAWGTLGAPPAGYGCQSATAQELATGGRVSYYTFGPDPSATGLGPGSSRSASPVSVLRHMPSFSSGPSSAADSSSCDDGRSVSSADEEPVALGGAAAAAARRARAAALAWAKALDAEAAQEGAVAAAAQEAAAARRGRESVDLANATLAAAGAH